MAIKRDEIVKILEHTIENLDEVVADTLMIEADDEFDYDTEDYDYDAEETESTDQIEPGTSLCRKSVK